MAAPVLNPGSVLAIGTLLLAGCQIPVLTSTPEVSKFALADSEWGRPADRLVVACYRFEVGKFVRSAHRFRVLDVGSDGLYATGPEPLWGSAGLTNFGFVFPYLTAQAEPAHVVFSTTGAFGVYEPIQGTDTLCRQSDVPLLARGASGLQVLEDTMSRPASEVDCLMGIRLGGRLLAHQPEGGPSVGPRFAIPREDAARLGQYVADHSSQFSRMTQMLARRLTECYERNLGPTVGASIQDYSTGCEPSF